MKRVMTASVALALGLSACAQPGQQGYGEPGGVGLNKTTGGTLLGAGAGALAGNQFGSGSGKAVMTVIGGLLGAFAGNSIGRQLDQDDVNDAERAGQQAFESGPSGTPVQWRNPDTGNYGTIVPQPARQDGGTYCREFQQTIVVGGQTQQGYGRACRQPDGTWKIVS